VLGLNQISKDISAMRADIAGVQSTLQTILKNQSIIKKELRRIMTDQDKLDALVASEQAEIADLGASAQSIAEEIAALKAAAAANKPLDFSKAEAAIADLTTTATAVSALKPAPTPGPGPTPEPTPTPEPVPIKG